jgi:hypothetical protein
MDNQRHRQHWVHITQNEDKQNKKHNTEKYKDEQHGPPQKTHRWLNTGVCEPALARSLCMMTMKLPGWAKMLSNLIRKCRRLITHFQRYPSFFTIHHKSEFN